MKTLQITEMETLTAGGKYLSFACGAGIALSVFTGGIGAALFGPSTVGVCIAAMAS